jgi:heme/copper-type cytochrome/quinol oxidase subunit 2
MMYFETHKVHSRFVLSIGSSQRNFINLHHKEEEGEWEEEEVEVVAVVVVVVVVVVVAVVVVVIVVAVVVPIQDVGGGDHGLF